jgi:hypothetical protein
MGRHGMAKPLVGWAKYRDAVFDMVDQRKWPIEWIERRVSDGSIALFECETAIMGVEKRVYPGGLVELHCMFVAGDLAGVRELTDIACLAGRKDGCDIAALESRAGWCKVLEPKGFAVEQTRLVKDLV